MKKMSPRQQAIKNNDKTYEGRPCKEGHTTRSTKWRTCIECERARWGKSSEYTKEKKRARAKVYNSTPAARKKKTEYRMKRYHSEPVYRLKDIRKRQLLQFIKRVGGTKTKRTEELLGYTAEELKVHLELLFKEGMTWENQGEWHIDHRIPASYFTSIDQMRECFALSNLKPEWGDWNMSKGNRFIG